MIEQDIFVGFVAVGLGFFVVGSAILNTQGFSRFWLCRRMENAFGSEVSRCVGGLVGLLVATLGVLLMLGMLPAKKSRQGQTTEFRAMACGYGSLMANLTPRD